MSIARTSASLLLLMLCCVVDSQSAAAQSSSSDGKQTSLSSSSSAGLVPPLEDDPSKNDEESSRVNGLKAMSIVCTLSLSLLLNLLVLKLPCLSQNKYKSVIRTANAFSAGIFLVLSVTHLLPEAVDVFEDEKHSFHTFRPPYAMCVLGFLAMMCLQRGLFGFDEKNLVAALSTSPRADEDAFIADVNKHDDGKAEEMRNSQAQDDGPSHTSSRGEDPPSIVSTPSSPGNDQWNEPVSSGEAASVQIDHERDNGKPREEAAAAAEQQSITSHHIPLVILLLVFSLHSFTEGMVLGLEKTDSGVIVVFLAIFLHQWAEDITFALRTGKSGTLSPCWRVALTCIEAFSAPTGMAVGWLLESVIDDLTGAYIIAFSAGTFIFISCTEIMPETLPSGQRNVPQFLAVCAGGTLLFFVMALLEAYL